MRTWEEIFAQGPPLFDILVWIPCRECEGRRITWDREAAVPCDCKFGGRWERHAALDTVGPHPNAMFPTDAEDLLEIFSTLSIMDLSMMCLHYTYRRLTRSISEKAPDWVRAWTYLRRHMPLTEYSDTFKMLNPGRELVSAGPIPRSKDLFPKPLQPKPPVSSKVRSGGSKPIAGAAGVQNFHVLYMPNVIEARDVAFMALQPLHQAVMRTLCETKKKVLSRAELYTVVTKSKWLVPYLRDGNGWGAWTRARPKLIQGGFVGEEYPPSAQRQGKTGIRPVAKQRRNRKRAA